MEASGIRIINIPQRDIDISFYDIADIHLLNRGFSKTHLMRDISRIHNDSNAFFFIGGDYGDFIHPSDKRFDPTCFDEDLKVIDLTRMGAKIVELMIEYFKPIKDRCCGILIGNHEKQYINRQSQEFIHSELCSALGAPNMGYSGFCDVYFVHNHRLKKPTLTVTDIIPDKYISKVRIFIHHGMGAANTAGGKINKLKSLVDMVDADLVMMGHVHEQFTKAFLRLTTNYNCTTIEEKPVMGLITGSYLKTYAQGFTGYGEMRAYFPATLGATRATYNPAIMEMSVENKVRNVGKRWSQKTAERI